MRVVIFACILRLLEATLALCPRAFLAPDCAGRVFEIISSEEQEDNLTFAQELASPLGELAFTPHMAWTSPKVVAGSHHKPQCSCCDKRALSSRHITLPPLNSEFVGSATTTLHLNTLMRLCAAGLQYSAPLLIEGNDGGLLRNQSL